ncbi:MAG: alpha/beta hydrolase [Gammaproteobacteria bacterium]
MRITTAIFCLVTALAATPAAGAATTAALAFAPCQIGLPGSLLHMQAECTYLSVPEDYAKPRGNHISLHIAVLRAQTANPAPDPLFFIAGGPGEGSTEAYPQEAAAFEGLRAARAIVLVDQRGTGGSNPLACNTATPNLAIPTKAEIAEQAAACLKRLRGNPRFYTTSVAVKDLDAVRAALGYKEIDLYGVSYGTRVALEYLRAYPTHTRSLILDGVVPPNWNVGERAPEDAQRALDGIFARCARQPDCQRAFPHLPAAFNHLEQTLKQAPASVTLRNPLTGAPELATLAWPTAASAIELMSYTSETAALLPLLIHQAGVEHDYAPLLANAEMVDQQVNGAVALGMHATVLCTEDVPFYPPGLTTSKEVVESFLGTAPITALTEICAHWPRGVMEPDFKIPVTSAKPVLLLSGADDPITPPANAAEVARTLPNSLSIVLAGQGHGNAWRGCVPELIERFVRQASVRDLDTACVRKIQPFPFFTSFTGPGP